MSHRSSGGVEQQYGKGKEQDVEVRRLVSEDSSHYILIKGLNKCVNQNIIHELYEMFENHENRSVHVFQVLRSPPIPRTAGRLLRCGPALRGRGRKDRKANLSHFGNPW